MDGNAQNAPIDWQHVYSQFEQRLQAQQEAIARKDEEIDALSRQNNVFGQFMADMQARIAAPSRSIPSPTASGAVSARKALP